MDDIATKLKAFVDEDLANILLKYEEDEFDNILDQRDDESFSDIWMKAYDEVKLLSEQKNIDKTFSDQLREAVFKKVLGITNISDLASYLSDDFGLIYDSVMVQFSSNWINALWNKYKSNELPYGNFTELEGELEELILN